MALPMQIESTVQSKVQLRFHCDANEIGSSAVFETWGVEPKQQDG